MLTDAGVALGELHFVVLEPDDGSPPWVASIAGAVEELLQLRPSQVLGQPLGELLEGLDGAFSETHSATAGSPPAAVTRLRVGSQAPGYARLRPLHTVSHQAWLVDFHTLRPARQGGQQTLPALAGLPFAGLAHTVPALLFACSPDGSAVYVNEQWFEYTGLVRDGTIAEHWVELVHPQDRRRLAQQWHRAQAGPAEFEAEFRLRDSQGQYRWHLCRARLVAQPDGTPMLWAGIATEIEHQKLIEDALDRREREFRTLVENAPDVITRLDLQLRHVYANRAIEPAFGVAPAALIGRTSAEAGLPAQVAQAWKTAAVAALVQGEEQECQFTVRRPEGAQPPVGHYICRLIPEFDRRGEIESVLCIAYDITQRRHAVSALEESEQRFRQFAESSDDVFWLADVAGGALLYVSPAFERLWGVPAESLRERPQRWNEAVLPADRHQLPEPFFVDAAHHDGVREYRIRRPDGDMRWIRDRRFLLRDQSGRPVRIGGIAEDITERKQREIEREELLDRERSARAEAEALASAKDEFLAVVSHELRSPLNAIRGWAHVLRQTGGLTDAQLRALDAIDRNTQSQARMVDDLLDTQRLLRSKVQLDSRCIALAPVVEQAVDTFRPTVQAKGIGLNVHHDTRIQMVSVDADRLRQALVNLISNAVKFTPEGGRIDVCTRLGGSGFEIEVRDTGIGIQPGMLPTIFDRFRQADGSSTRRQGGLGLGLTLARQLVELHGGRLLARSDGPGRGASFVIELPRSRLLHTEQDPSSSAAAPVPHPNAHLLAGKHVLIVEDDPDGREILQFLLREQNARVTAFDQARGAFDYLRCAATEERPDLVVSDIAMPDEDGYSFIRRWRSEEAILGLPPVPAVAVSAFSGPRDRTQALDSGFDTHLAKPIDAYALIDALVELLQQGGGGVEKPSTETFCRN
ncbi:MAG TPA: PAS domain S-box protein [Burkholderiaceae bacterium]|nr:PAS domain S-box protein [Burkholderiaceae bacterium]